MPGPPALRGGEEKLYVKKKEGMWLDGETPGCILARFELSEATSAKQGENSTLYHTDRLFSENNDHNLNIVRGFKLAAWNEDYENYENCSKW